MATCNGRGPDDAASSVAVATRPVPPASDPAPALAAHGLVKTYPGGVRALDGLTFAVEPGTIYGLLGPNGAGKSTTVKIFSTLSRPDAGRAQVAGLDVVRQPDQVRRVIGCVAQRSGVDLEATGRENLALQGHLYGLQGRALAQRVAALLQSFRLTDAADRVARTYSGGMQRKLDVAMGLVHQPRVLFLDEPTAGLDPEARADLWAEIRRLAEQDGLTILLTTHYLEEADRLARRLAIVDRGRVVVEGSPEQLKRELRGDAIHVELGSAETDGRVRRALEGDGGVHAVEIYGRTEHARVEHGATALPAVLGALEYVGVPVVAVTVARPSLDDVYLRYAGRAFAAGDDRAGSSAAPTHGPKRGAR
jgi:ABC-2 type transport system ATP-binding protein